MSHPLFRSPAPETKIWRYTDVAKFVSMLESSSIYVSNLLSLSESDPYEGHFPDAQVSAFAALRAMPIATIREVLKFDANIDDETIRLICDTNLRALRGDDFRRGCVYVNCWHMNEAESDAMWRLYTLQGQGIVVQSTYDRLARCFHMTQPHVQIGQVSYHDYDNHSIPLENTFYPALSKRRSFEHERELRVAILNMSRAYTQKMEMMSDREVVLSASEIPDGFPVEVDLDILIERVVVSPRSPSWLVSLIPNLLRRYGLAKPVVWSPLYTLGKR